MSPSNALPSTPPIGASASIPAQTARADAPSGGDRVFRGARSAFRRVMGAVAALAVGATLAFAPAPHAEARGFTGTFLAARHAEAVRDFGAAAYYYRQALGYEWNNQQLMHRALHYSVLAGDVAEAVSIARRMLRANPRHRLASLVVAVDLMRRGRFADAREIVSRTNEMSPLMSGLARAWSAFGQGDVGSTAREFETLAENQRSRRLAAFHEGLAAAASGDYEAALAAFERARGVGGQLNVRLTLAIGAVLERLGRRDDAEALYAGFLAQEPFNVLILEAQARFEAGGPAQLLVASPSDGLAEAFYAASAMSFRGSEEQARWQLIFAQLALYLSPDFAEAKIVAADLFARFEQSEAAAEVYGRVPADAAVYPTAQIGRATALNQLGRIDEALAALRGLGERADLSAVVHFNVAGILRRAGRYEECVVANDAGFAALGDDLQPRWVYYFHHGICLERTGEWDRAEEAFLVALELEPDQPSVLNYLGYSLVEQGRRFEEALEMIERAVAADPNSGYIVDSLGWALYRMGDYEGAVVHLERAVALAPVEPVINDHLGDALWRVGRRTEARFQWSRALSFNPTDEERVRIERKLDVGLDVVLEEEARDEAEGAPNTPGSDEDASIGAPNRSDDG